MTPSTLHRFHHVTAGVRLEVTWDQVPDTRESWWRQTLRRLLVGGPDPASPQVLVPQAAFDRALDLLNAGPSHLEDAEAAFRKLGYTVVRSEEGMFHEVRA